MRTFLITASWLALSISVTQAAERMGNPAEGKKLATTLCANCHDVAGTTKNPPGGAPAFVTVAGSGKSAPELRKFLRLPHGKMTNVLLSEGNTDDVVSYIQSLAAAK